MPLTFSPPADATHAPPAERLDADFYDLQSALTDAERAQLGRIRTFLRDEVAPRADEFWERAESPRHLFPRFAELGMLGAGIPEVAQYDNSALYRGWVALEISRVDASTATFLGVHSGLAMNAIWVGGSDEQRAQWLPPMARGELVGAFALTEPLSGSDTARGLRTTATRRTAPDGTDEWVIDGAKRWIGSAGFSDITVVWAKDTEDGEMKGFIVPTSTPGYSATKIERKQSLRAVENADITLTGVVVPDALRLQRIESFTEVAIVLRLTRAEVAWQGLGNGIGAYEAAVRYTATREQFGKPIASFQLVQDKLATALSNITACLALCTRVSQLQDEGAQTDAQAAMAKAFVTARMRETVALCREVMGGNGITLDYGAARAFCDAEAIYTFEGTHDMNTLIVGREITGIQAFVA